MAREPIGIGSYIQVYNRGVKKLPIYREKRDLRRLVGNLYYLNHAEAMPSHWVRDIAATGNFDSLEWPEAWGERQPIVSILAYSIMSNHLHLVMKEIIEGGVSRFMHRISMAYSKYINEKYGESGSLFQGPFKSRVVEKDEDLRNLAVYVMVKNTFELYPNGLHHAIANFDDSYSQAAADTLNSLGTYAGTTISPIISKDIYGEVFETPDSFKEFAQESMRYRLEQIESTLT